MSERTRSAHEHHHRCLTVSVPEALWPQQMLSVDVDSGPHILLRTCDPPAGALANEDPKRKDKEIEDTAGMAPNTSASPFYRW